MAHDHLSEEQKRHLHKFMEVSSGYEIADAAAYMISLLPRKVTSAEEDKIKRQTRRAASVEHYVTITRPAALGLELLVEEFERNPFIYHQVSTLLARNRLLPGVVVCHHWGMLDRQPPQMGDSDHPIVRKGFWRANQKAVDFVRDGTLVKHFAVVLLGNVVDHTNTTKRDTCTYGDLSFEEALHAKFDPDDIIDTTPGAGDWEPS